MVKVWAAQLRGFSKMRFQLNPKLQVEWSLTSYCFSHPGAAKPLHEYPLNSQPNKTTVNKYGSLNTYQCKLQTRETGDFLLKENIQLLTPILPPDPSCKMDGNSKSSTTTMSSSKKEHLSSNRKTQKKVITKFIPSSVLFQLMTKQYLTEWQKDNDGRRDGQREAH